MGNKQILAQNNETLASILSNVLGLPSQESLKHGAYVWKKYERIYLPEETISSPVIQLIGKSGEDKLYITSSNFDLTRIEQSTVLTSSSAFSGFNLSGNYPIIKHDTMHSGLYYQVSNNGTYYMISGFEPTSANKGYFTLESSLETIVNQTLTKSSSITLPEVDEKTFLYFTVSDDPTAYPDGGEHGGYWYEKVNAFEGLIGIFGLTKIAVDKFTYTTRTGLTRLSHSLGETPKFAIAFSDTVPSKNDYDIVLCAGFDLYNDANYGGIITSRYKGNLSGFLEVSGGAFSKSGWIWNEAQIKLNAYAPAGAEITLITMA